MTVSCCLPLIFTRTKYVDYRLLVVPDFLKGSSLEETIWDKVTSLCSVDGYRGGLSGRRWQVLRLGDYVLFGFASDEFKREDVGKRSIRGYYGLVFPKDYVHRLDIGGIDWKSLDKKYVGAVFDNESTQTSYVAQEGMFERIFSNNEASSHRFYLNTDTHYIGVVGINKIAHDNDVYRLLYEALSLAGKEEQFELIVGVNNLRHAEELGTLNVVSYDCYDDGLYDLNEHKLVNMSWRHKFLRSLKLFWRY